MRAQQKECPVIGGPSVCPEPSPRDGNYEELWAHYGPKVSKIATQYCIEGAVGAEHDDLMSIGHQMLLHCIRKHDEAKSRFSTYFYTCLKNEYAHLLKRCYPKRRYMVIAFDPATGGRELLKCTGAELESVLMTLRTDGKTYSVLPKSRNTRYPMLDCVESLDKPAGFAVNSPGFSVDPAAAFDHAEYSQQSNSVGSLIAAPDAPMTVDEVLERIRHRIPDENLRQMAVWLFEGHKMTGPDGIMKRLGLKKHQVERHMHRIRMLLAGEFGLAIANPQGA